MPSPPVSAVTNDAESSGKAPSTIESPEQVLPTAATTIPRNWQEWDEFLQLEPGGLKREVSEAILEVTGSSTVKSSSNDTIRRDSITAGNAVPHDQSETESRARLDSEDTRRLSASGKGSGATTIPSAVSRAAQEPVPTDKSGMERHFGWPQGTLRQLVEKVIHEEKTKSNSNVDPSAE